MKNILIGIAIALCIAAGAVKADVLTVKPAMPKVCLVKSFKWQDNSELVAKYIRKKVSEGWVFKSVDGANESQNRSTWIVVMEKY